MADRDLGRWEAKGMGGGGPLLMSFCTVGGGIEGGCFLGSGLVGVLWSGGMGGGGPLWKCGLNES